MGAFDARRALQEFAAAHELPDVRQWWDTSGPMADGKPDTPLDKDPWADVRGRFGDIYETAGKAPRGRWAAIKDRLAIVAVVLVLAILVFLMLDGSFVNFRCTFGEFVTFECNRWAGEEHPSLRKYKEKDRSEQ